MEDEKSGLGGCGRLALVGAVLVGLLVVAGQLSPAGDTPPRGEPTAFDTAYRFAQVLRGRMKDPDSIKFRSVMATPAIVCGFYNAKNSFGAYAGFEPFVGVRTPSPKLHVYGEGGFADVWQAKCGDLSRFREVNL